MESSFSVPVKPNYVSNIGLLTMRDLQFGVWITDHNISVIFYNKLFLHFFPPISICCLERITLSFSLDFKFRFAVYNLHCFEQLAITFAFPFPSQLKWFTTCRCILFLLCSFVRLINFYSFCFFFFIQVLIVNSTTNS